MGFLNTLKFITEHPLNRDQKARAVARFLRWQIGSRIVPGPVAVPFVEKTRLLLKPGMTGATGNLYTGLHEFNDMAFVLHALRDTDFFIDVGANVGAYTLLAAGEAGARCLSLEPEPATFACLTDNIRLNNLQGRVRALAQIASSKKEKLSFTSTLGPCNHVVGGLQGASAGLSLDAAPLDDLAGDEEPIVMKIDVEGYETEVVAGAQTLLAAPSLGALIMEYGFGPRYGFDEEALHKKVLGYGFSPYRYAPFDRALTPIDGRENSGGNTLYIKDLDRIQERLRTARTFRIHGKDL